MSSAVESLRDDGEEDVEDADLGVCDGAFDVGSRVLAAAEVGDGVEELEVEEVGGYNEGLAQADGDGVVVVKYRGHGCEYERSCRYIGNSKEGSKSICLYSGWNREWEAVGLREGWKHHAVCIIGRNDRSRLNNFVQQLYKVRVTIRSNQDEII